MHMIMNLNSTNTSFEEAVINVYNFRELVIECGNIEDLNLVININSNISYYNESAKIFCYTFNACDNLQINTNVINTQLLMYNYSSDVILNNGIGYLPEL